LNRHTPTCAAAAELGQELDAVVIEELVDGWLVFDIPGGALVKVNDLGSLAVGQRLQGELDL
jgi:hypothetical protein